ncbi:MAG: hypothetical protein J5666_05025 [Bacilli bacterium]|nr:hypothetical protein [Bacilli bacterium]
MKFSVLFENKIRCVEIDSQYLEDERFANNDETISASQHDVAKLLLKKYVIDLISKEESISIIEAKEKLKSSGISALIDDDETGLYDESPLYVFSIYQNL